MHHRLHRLPQVTDEDGFNDIRGKVSELARALFGVIVAGPIFCQQPYLR